MQKGGEKHEKIDRIAMILRMAVRLAVCRQENAQARGHPPLQNAPDVRFGGAAVGQESQQWIFDRIGQKTVRTEQSAPLHTES